MVITNKPKEPAPDEVSEMKKFREEMLRKHPEEKKVEPKVEKKTESSVENKEIKSKPKAEEKKVEKKETATPQTEKKQIQFTVSLSPWKILKVFLVLLIISGVFIGGRISSDYTFGFDGVKKTADISAAATAEKPVELTEPVVEPEVVADVPEEAADEPAEEAAAEPVVETVAEPAAEPVVTDYKNVNLNLAEVHVKWMDTWGKITGIDYSVENGAGGRVLADHFVLIVEGYDEDRAKTFAVNERYDEISAGISDGEVTVPNGFSYNEITTGDLTNVRITLVLYDAEDKLIASANEEVDLTG